MTQGADDVVEDLSAYLISGAVSAVQGDVDYESDQRTPAQGIQDAVDAGSVSARRSCQNAGTSSRPTSSSPAPRPAHRASS